MSHPKHFTINKLAKKSGVSVRTIRYYVTEGLLPQSHGAGRGAYYDEAHLNRIYLIQRMQNEHKSLSLINGYLERMTDEDVQTGLTSRKLDRYLNSFDQAQAQMEDGTPGLETPLNFSDLVQVVDSDRLDSVPDHYEEYSQEKFFDAPTEPVGEQPAGAEDEDDYGDIDLGDLSPAELVAFRASSTKRRPAHPAEKKKQVPRLTRSSWHRYRINADVEIHIRRPLSVTDNKRLEKLLQSAVDLFFKNTHK